MSEELLKHIIDIIIFVLSVPVYLWLIKILVDRVAIQRNKEEMFLLNDAIKDINEIKDSVNDLKKDLSEVQNEISKFTVTNSYTDEKIAALRDRLDSAEAKIGILNDKIVEVLSFLKTLK